MEKMEKPPWRNAVKQVLGSEYYMLNIVDDDRFKIDAFAADAEKVPVEKLTGITFMELNDDTYFLSLTFTDKKLHSIWLENAKFMFLKVNTIEEDYASLMRMSRFAILGSYIPGMMKNGSK